MSTNTLQDLLRQATWLKKIVHGTEEDKEAYLTYLKAGSSDYPLEVIKKAGVDMTNTDYLDAAFKVLKTVLLNWKPWLKKVCTFLKKKSHYERIILNQDDSFFV